MYYLFTRLLLFLLLYPDIPAGGQLHEIMAISYTIHNRTTLVQEVEAKMGQSEAFMYSGNRQVRTTVFLLKILMFALILVT